MWHKLCDSVSYWTITCLCLFLFIRIVYEMQYLKYFESTNTDFGRNKHFGVNQCVASKFDSFQTPELFQKWDKRTAWNSSLFGQRLQFRSGTGSFWPKLAQNLKKDFGWINQNPIKPHRIPLNVSVSQILTSFELKLKRIWNFFSGLNWRISRWFLKDFETF